MNPFCLISAIFHLPGRLADAAWEWGARKVLPLDETEYEPDVIA